MKRKTLFKHFAIIIGCISVAVKVEAQAELRLNSPENHIQAKVSVSNEQLHYAVSCNGNLVCESDLSFLADGKIYGQSVQSLRSLSRERIRRRFDVRGVHAVAATDKNTYQIGVSSVDGATDFHLVFNVYDNGIAIRYEAGTAVQQLTKDLSGIQFPQDAVYWWQGDVENYEGDYTSSKTADFKDGQKIGMPLTVAVPNGLYAAVMEANLHNFVGSFLRYDKKHAAFDYTLAGPVSVRSGQLKSSWRIIAIGNDLNSLVNNDIVSDVADSPGKTLYPQGLHTAWIQPGKSLWSWMSNKRDVTPENMKRFTDAAAQLHIPYNLIDDGWGSWKADGKDNWALMKEQVQYARQKGVGIWVWKAYPGDKHIPGLNDSAYMAGFFEKCAALGVKGLKIDFIGSERQPEIAFYERAARLAAKYHMMVDFHGADKATGLEYTYPNVLSQEGVRGLEQGSSVNWPYHNTVVPFTRYLSGPADFTPMSFRSFVNSTTLAHQVATAAIYTSPFLCLGVDPDDLLKSEALPFICNMPATWDETIVLKESRIGKRAVYARRKNKKWYLAVTNGEEPAELNIALDFLPARTRFSLKALTDSKAERTTKVTEMQNINRRSVLHIAMPSGGGYLGVLE